MERQQPEVARVARMMQAACPPSEMAAAAVAPARGTMQLVATFELLPGGRQRRDGSHWRSASVLEVMMVQAQRRAERAEPDQAPRRHPRLQDGLADQARDPLVVGLVGDPGVQPGRQLHQVHRRLPP
jgi:hypothetical protein